MRSAGTPTWRRAATVVAALAAVDAETRIGRLTALRRLPRRQPQRRVARPALDQGRQSHAARHAEGGDAVADAAPGHAVEQGDQDAGAGGADGVAEGDGAAVRIDLAGVEVQLLQAGQHLRGEGLVEFHLADVAGGAAGAGEQPAHRRHRADAHDPGLDPDHLPVHQPRRHRQPQLLGGGRRGDQQGRRAVGDPRGVAGGHRPAVAEDRRQPGQRLDGDAVAGVLVRRHQHAAAPPAWPPELRPARSRRRTAPPRAPAGSAAGSRRRSGRRRRGRCPPPPPAPRRSRPSPARRAGR